MNKQLIVLGMHRSGTSLVAKWLQSCGLNIGDDLMGAGIGNEAGHFEDWEFFKLHERLLRKNGMTWQAGYNELRGLKISNHDRHQAAAMAANKNDLYAEWGWKEPRTCLFLGLWRDVLPNAKYLIIYRDYREVVDSLTRRDLKVASLAGKTDTSSLADQNVGRFRSTRRSIKRNIRVIFNYCRSRVRRLFTEEGLNSDHDSNDKFSPQSLSAEEYREVCDGYCRCILDHLSCTPKESTIVVDLADLFECGEKVVALMREQWGFTSLQHAKLDDVYDPEMMKSASSCGQYDHPDSDRIKEQVMRYRTFPS